MPLLVGVFRLPTLEAVILNKAISLMVVAAGLAFRVGTIAPTALAPHLDVVLNLLAGSLIGAWWAAGHAITLPRHWLNPIVMVLLLALSLIMLAEAWAGRGTAGAPLFELGLLRVSAGVIAGLGIGSAAGALLVGWVQPALLMALLGVLLFVSAVKTFRHVH